MSQTTDELELAQIISRFQERTLGQGYGIGVINDTCERLLVETLAELSERQAARDTTHWENLMGAISIAETQSEVFWGNGQQIVRDIIAAELPQPGGEVT